MIRAVTRLEFLPCIDSPDIAESRRKELEIGRNAAADLGQSAVEASRNGYYVNMAGERIDWRSSVQSACATKRSIPPDDRLPTSKLPPEPETRVQVANETTLQASRRLVEAGLRPLALNFCEWRPSGRRLSPWRAGPGRSAVPVQRALSHARRRSHVRFPRTTSAAGLYGLRNLFPGCSHVQNRRRNRDRKTVAAQFCHVRCVLRSRDRSARVGRPVTETLPADTCHRSRV
jgi:Uncharacterized protein conserved in bacteria (DUF2263)